LTDNTEFHVISIEELPQLGLSFDYINCDEVLYFFPDPSVGLQAMKSVLQPDGIIRTNLHYSVSTIISSSGSLQIGVMDDNL